MDNKRLDELDLYVNNKKKVGIQMIKKIFRKMKFLKLLFKNDQEEHSKKTDSEVKIVKNIDKNIEFVREKFGKSSDLVIRRITIGSGRKKEAAVVYVEGLVDKTTVNESILRPLMVDARLVDNEGTVLKKNIVDLIQSSTITIGDIKNTKKLNYLVDSILTGETAVIINGCKKALLIGTRGWEERGIQQPETEVVIRGPREAFTETLRTNTAQLRRKIHNPNLVFESMKLGEQTKTEVCIAYIKGIANEKLINEIKRRLERVQTDAILESGYIEEFIEDAPFSPFSTVANTERPDVTAAKILEGRAAILVDGTPFALTVPMLFVESLQISEDYYSRPYYATIIRWIRFTALFVSILSPAVYVALATYHQEIIPTPLLITMIAATEGTPFPAFFAALMMGVVFEILREAGVRLPRPVGQAISIVGALVIGEAAVSAGLISAPMVIMVALTAIATFVVSAQSDAATILRLFLVILAGCLGAFGIMIGLLGILIHIVSLRSFGAPYFSPIAPLSFRDLKDVIIRSPIWAMFTRPRTIGWHDPQRQDFMLMPHPPQKNKEFDEDSQQGGPEQD